MGRPWEGGLDAGPRSGDALGQEPGTSTPPRLPTPACFGLALANLLRLLGTTKRDGSHLSADQRYFDPCIAGVRALTQLCVKGSKPATFIDIALYYILASVDTVAW